MRSNEESRIQQACVKWFRFQHRQLAGVLFAVPNGGARRPIEASIMKGEGVLAGVSDLILLHPNSEHHGLLIEMKTSKGRQQETQKEFQKNVERQGYKYIICRSLEEFVSEVNSYLKG